MGQPFFQHAVEPLASPAADGLASVLRSFLVDVLAYLPFAIGLVQFIEQLAQNTDRQRTLAVCRLVNVAGRLLRFGPPKAWAADPILDVVGQL